MSENVTEEEQKQNVSVTTQSECGTLAVSPLIPHV